MRTDVPGARTAPMDAYDAPMLTDVATGGDDELAARAPLESRSAAPSYEHHAML